MTDLDRLLRRMGEMTVIGTERHWALIPPGLARRLRPRVLRVGDGILTLLEKSNALRMNRVAGLGHNGGAREAMIDEIIEHYRAARLSRFSVLVEPGPQAKRIEGWLRKRGFEPHGGTNLFLRDCRIPVPSIESEVRVERVRAKDRTDVVRIHHDTFGIPSSYLPWSTAAAAARGYEHFIAFVGKEPAAVGALRVDGDMAWLGGGATRTRWRRRGAQSSLIASRLKRAARLGCAWAYSETNLPTPGRPQGSRRNLLRLGFEPVATRKSFVWSA